MKKLADKDELGNSVAHFFKSGNVLRSRENDKLCLLKEMMPKEWVNSTRVEYDIWYDIGGGKNIHGYVYTDVLTRFLYIRVANQLYASRAMKKASECSVTAEGEKLFKELADRSFDKYRMRATDIEADFVIFLAGTNILNKMTNWNKVDNAVKQGAKLKCHPLTAPAAFAYLKNKYGSSIIDKKISGHTLLNNASIVGCCDNSEMGIAALAKGKTVYNFGNKGEWSTYSAIYRALMVGDKYSCDKLKSILSCESSGLIPSAVDHPENRIKAFFKEYENERHIAPKNFSNRVKQANPADG